MEGAKSCTFCRILRGELTPGVVAFRDARTAVFPSRLQQPHNRGHMLVVPVRHVSHIYELDGDLAGPLMTTLARVAATQPAGREGEGRQAHRHRHGRRRGRGRAHQRQEGRAHRRGRGRRGRHRLPLPQEA